MAIKAKPKTNPGLSSSEGQNVKLRVYPPLEKAIADAQARNRQIQAILYMVDVLHLDDTLDEIDIGDVIDVIATVSDILDQHLATIEHISLTGTVED